MTDNEIIKALERCFIYGNCTGCPLQSPPTEGCLKVACIRAIDLINRQKAEIERLQSMNQAKLDMIHDIRARLEVTKAEAIKEFAERMKAEISDHLLKGSHTWNTYHFNRYEAETYGKLVDNLVKEMTKGGG